MTQNKTYGYLWHVLIGLMFVPMLQQSFQWLQFDPLNGYDNEQTQESNWSWKDWISTNYQRNKEQYRVQNLGFRAPLIRFQNQLDYSLFNYSNVDNVVIGKDDYLFGSDYVKAYTGQNFVGLATVNAKVNRFKRIQDTLDQLGKHLVLLITPNKADYFEAFLPASYRTDGRQPTTNYRTYVKAMQQHALHLVDLQRFFCAARDTLAYAAFPKTGVHLTPYGTAVFTDTLIRYLEQQLKQDLPDFSYELQWTDSSKMDETDAEDALNLMIDLRPNRFMNLQARFNYRNKYQPNVLAIGDSFYWNFLALRSDKYLFHHHRFLYYNKEAYPGGDVKNLNLAQEIERAEVILIVNSAFNLWRFGFDFDLDLYLHFFGEELKNNAALFDQIVQEKIISAKKNPEWMRYIRTQTKNGKGEEQVIYENVAYLLRKKLDHLHNN
jgi:hypothetical protein